MHRLSLATSLVVFALSSCSCRNPPSAVDGDASQTDLFVDQGRVDLRKETGCISQPEAGLDLALDSGHDLARDLLRDAPPPVDGPLVDATTLDAPPLDAPPPDAPPSDALPSKCPACMVLVGNTCFDRYEASRTDATATAQGTQTGKAMCKKGVIPWHSFSLTKVEAQTACAAAGKRLCKPAEWLKACQGPKKTVYSYGNKYDPSTCNGIDTYCLCGAGQACAGVTPCPYPHCFNMPPPGGSPATGCGSWFHVVTTGSFPGCEVWGIHDINGNVWELVDTSDGQLHFRGGAYNCGDSETLHRCDYDATWGPSAQGFRCCADPLP